MIQVRKLPPAALALAGVIMTGAAHAQPADPYFKGKTVTIAVGGTAGGGIDIGARLLARYLGKYLPGEPKVQVQLVPGAGGVRLIEQLYAVAPKDGSFIGAFSTGPIIEPLISLRNVKYKISDFTAVGALEKDVSVCVTWHRSVIRTLHDARAREVTVAGTGAASATDLFPLALNAVLGTKFRVISGYVGTQETLMAIERGETDGRCGWGFSSMKSSKPDWLRDQRLNFLVQFGIDKHPELHGVPSALDLVVNAADRQFMRVMVAPQGINRPYLAPPDLPPERAKEIRAAFMAAMQDDGLRAEFAKVVGEPPTPTGGADMQRLLEEIYATPADVVARLKAVLNPGK
jgi:tripartite-type tricarboxylate transporter receptor subunit TctC